LFGYGEVIQTFGDTMETLKREVTSGSPSTRLKRDRVAKFSSSKSLG